MEQKKPSVLGTITRLVFITLLLSLPVLFWFNRYDIYDWWRLRGYTPPAEVVALADNTKMEPHARRTFYANRPEFMDKDEIRNTCHQGEITIVLGCYINGQGIYLHDVTDERLSGVEEVTAAHEMLHAAYDRLSYGDKKKIDELTSKAIKQVDNQRILDTVEQYRKKDSRIVSNELHSILGSEARDLPPELEEYYKRYFSNRLAVVELSEHYDNEFTSRQATVASIDEQLAAKKTIIEENQQTLQEESANIQQERARLNALLAANDYEAYNSGVSAYNRQVAAYNNLASTTSSLIEQYNLLVNERNAIAIEVSDLAKAIDTRPEGITGQ